MIVEAEKRGEMFRDVLIEATAATLALRWR